MPAREIINAVDHVGENILPDGGARPSTPKETLKSSSREFILSHKRLCRDEMSRIYAILIESCSKRLWGRLQKVPAWHEERQQLEDAFVDAYCEGTLDDCEKAFCNLKQHWLNGLHYVRRHRS